MAYNNVVTPRIHKPKAKFSYTKRKAIFPNNYGVSKRGFDRIGNCWLTSDQFKALVRKEGIKKRVRIRIQADRKERDRLMSNKNPSHYVVSRIKRMGKQISRNIHFEEKLHREQHGVLARGRRSGK
jgi:hypothetical protein